MIEKSKKLPQINTYMGEKLQEGQALLIVVMVIVVALTVGLSVLVRSTSNVQISNEDENSQRAFSAAEAGVERSLVSGSAVPPTSLSTNTSYQTSVTTVSGSSFNLSNGTVILKDDPSDIWLSSYPAFATSWNGNITINWGSSSDVCDPNETVNTQSALEILLISGTKASPKITQYAMDPCASRTSVNKFQAPTVPGDTVSGKSYAYKKIIPVSSGLLIRIIPLYSATVVGVEGDSALPSQGTIVTATGVSDNSQRKIISYRGLPKLPVEIFPFNVFVQK